MGPRARGKGLTSDPVAGFRRAAMTQGAGARPSGCRSTGDHVEPVTVGDLVERSLRLQPSQRAI